MRSNMLEVLDEDFVTMARMKGLPEWRIMLAHAARNALLPIVTALTLGIGYAIGGNVVIENVFSWPGIGRLLVRAVSGARLSAGAGRFPLDRRRHRGDELPGRRDLQRARPAGLDDPAGGG